MTDCRHCSSGRRDFIKIAFGGAAATALSGRFLMPAAAATKPAKAKAVILLWMRFLEQSIPIWICYILVLALGVIVIRKG